MPKKVERKKGFPYFYPSGNPVPESIRRKYWREMKKVKGKR